MIQLAAHRRRLIVITGQAQNRQPEGTEQTTEVSVSGRVVLHDVACDQHGIWRPVARLRQTKRCLQRGQRSYPTE
jgi:hypothetical protein